MNKEPKVRSIGKVLTANTANTLYTCPENFVAKVILLIVSNQTASNKTVSIEWRDDSAAAQYHIVNSYTITSKTFLQIDGGYLVLNPGDTLILTPESGSTMDASVTVEEYYEQGLF